jgi:threonine/homoserine/homoserine lactone efflux protein
MDGLAEQIIVGLLIAAAAGYLLWRGWKKLRKGRGDACGTPRKTTLTIGGVPVKKR